MIRRSRKALTAAGLAGAAGVLALVLAGSGAALADPSPSPSPSASGSASAPGKADREARRAAERDKYAEALAKELGLDKAKVAAALDKVDQDRANAAKAEGIAALKTRLDAAVAEGKLTREQADAILKAAENGVFPGGPDGLGKPGGPRGPRPGR